MRCKINAFFPNGITNCREVIALAAFWPTFYVRCAPNLCSEAIMQQAKSYIEMAIESIQAFANDGKLDAAELQRMLDIALRDGQIDADELRVLGKIVTQAEKGPVDADVQALIAQIRVRHGLK